MQVQLLNEPKIIAIIDVIKGILTRDIELVFENLSILKDDLILPPKDNFENQPKFYDEDLALVKSIVVFSKKMMIGDKASNRRSIINSSEVLVKCLSFFLAQMPGENTKEEKKENEGLHEILSQFKSAIKIICAAIHGDIDLLHSELDYVFPMVKKYKEMWNFLKRVKEKLNEENETTIKLDPDTLSNMLSCYMSIIELTKKVVQVKTRTECELPKGNNQKPGWKPLKDYEGVASRSHKCLQALKDTIDSHFHESEEYLQSGKLSKLEISISIFLYYNKPKVETSNEYLKQAFTDLMNKLTEKDSEFKDHLNILILLLTGDSFLITDYLRNKEKKESSNASLDSLDFILEMINMNELKYKAMTSPGNEAKLMQYVEKIDKRFVKPLIAYLNNVIDERLVYLEKRSYQDEKTQIEKAALEKARPILANTDFMTCIVSLMHHFMYGTEQKSVLANDINSLLNSLSSKLSQKLKEIVPILSFALTGYKFGKISSSDSEKSDERKNALIVAFIDICMPSLKPKTELILRLISFTMYLAKHGSRSAKIKEDIPKIAEDLGDLLGINNELIQGLFGIMDGNISAIVKFVAPVCKISPESIETIMNLLQGAKRLVNAVTAEPKKTQKDDVENSLWVDLMKKVNEGKAGTRELFQLTDKMGDSSGGISVPEFEMLMNKMNMHMTTHRINEIFSRCKSKTSSKPSDELDISGIFIIMDK